MELFLISNQWQGKKQEADIFLRHYYNGRDWSKVVKKNNEDHRLSLSSEYNFKQFENSDDNDEGLDEMTL